MLFRSNHREIIPSDAALFAPPDAPEALAAALCDALSDRASARARAAAATRTADAWSIDAVARMYAGIYEQLR